MTEKPKDTKNIAKLRSQAKALTRLAYHGDPKAVAKVEEIPIRWEENGELEGAEAAAFFTDPTRQQYDEVVFSKDPATGEERRWLAMHELAGHVAGARGDEWKKGSMYSGDFPWHTQKSQEELHDTTTRMAVVEGRKNANWQQYLDLVDEFGMEQVQKWMKEGTMPPKPGDAFSFERMKEANPPAKIEGKMVKGGG